MRLRGPTPAPDLRVLISAWADGKDVRIRGDDGQWHDLTPDNIHGLTSEKEWVSLRDAIARFDARKEHG
jgi:hypothetical protein